MTERPFRFRNPELVVSILGYVYDADDPVPWNEILDLYTDDGRPWKTVENVLYELVTFGALHRVGKPAERNRPDSRALKPTTLGRAWLERELVPLPTDVDDDPLEQADRIARDLVAHLDVADYSSD